MAKIIVKALRDDAVRLCIDSNGNHVIQRALQFLDPRDNQFVFDAVYCECTTVGTHRHGCCVLQRCLDAANATQRRKVIAQVEKQAMKLMQDPYGNYVVQYILDCCVAEDAYGVMLKPLGHIYELSIQKFSSNVIEKCLEKAPDHIRQKYVKEIIACTRMNRMLQDQFANYVVQRALCVSCEEQCVLLVKAICPFLYQMRNTSGGRRITSRILKRFPSLELSLDSFGAVEHVGREECVFSNGSSLYGREEEEGERGIESTFCLKHDEDSYFLQDEECERKGVETERQDQQSLMMIQSNSSTLSCVSRNSNHGEEQDGNFLHLERKDKRAVAFFRDEKESKERPFLMQTIEMVGTSHA